MKNWAPTLPWEKLLESSMPTNKAGWAWSRGAAPSPIQTVRVDRINFRRSVIALPPVSTIARQAPSPASVSTKCDYRSTPAAGFARSVAEVHDERRSRQHGAHDLALHANAASMHDAQRFEAHPVGFHEVFFHNGPY